MTITEYGKIGRYGHAPSGTTSVDLPRVGKRAGGKIDVVHAHEVDPNSSIEQVKGGAGRRRQRVACNRNSDALEREASYGRLSIAARRVGMQIQATLEISRGQRGAAGIFEPSSGGGSADHGMVARLDAAFAANVLLALMGKIIGPEQSFLLAAVLGERLPFREAASRLAGKFPSKRWYASKGGTARAALEFRQALEELAEDPRWN